MKILFISRATLYKDKGGDTFQIINTATHLKNLGIHVEIKLCNENINYDPYDLLHFFNIIRPADILLHIKRSQKPFVVSTIYVNYSEFEKKYRTGLIGAIFKTLSPDAIEYIKVIGRWLLANEKIISREYFFLGQEKSIKKIIKGAALLLPNSNNEYKRLTERYKIKQRYCPIPNAINPLLFSGKVSNKEKNMVLCVGRIEGRKNQLNLIKALNNSIFELIIIGSPAINQANYFKECKKKAAPNVRFIENLPQEQLIEYYNKARVHVLPSWFETTGLSSLEAAAMGCNIVITDKGDTREYFEDLAFYCDPSSPKSIKEAVELAASEPFNENLRSKVFREYIWPVSAEKTLEAYKIALG